MSHNSQNSTAAKAEKLTPAPRAADLDKSSKALWALVQRHLRVMRLWDETVIETVLAYCRANQDAREYRRLIGVEGLTTTGSKGQTVAHPLLKNLREAELDQHRYGEALLLTPEMRKRHAIKSGESTGLSSPLGKVLQRQNAG